jgi:hypothetical protein
MGRMSIFRATAVFVWFMLGLLVLPPRGGDDLLVDPRVPGIRDGLARVVAVDPHGLDGEALALDYRFLSYGDASLLFA